MRTTIEFDPDTDAVLAANCIEYGLDIISADSDFARFTDITWINPVA